MSLDIIGRPVKYLYEDQSSFTDFKYLFDGVDDSIQYENIDYNGGNTTISMWVNLSAKNNTQLFLWSSASTNTALFFNGADLFIAGATLSGTLEAGGIPLDEDVQITLTINNGVCNCYINGVLSSGSPVTTNVTEFDSLANTLEIGSGFTGTMEGVYDQFVVYSRVLSQGEIAQLYNNGEKVNTNFLRTTQGFVFLSLNREIEEAYGVYDSFAVNGAPDVVNYSSKGLFQTSTTLSTWNAVGGDLPVRYKIQSDIYPNNTVDTVYAITSAASFFGDTVFTTSASHGYVKGDYVTISDSTIEAYNGIHKITNVVSVTSFSINVLFSGTATANVIKYYNLYNVVLNVYGGLPDYHVLSSDSPMQLVGSVSISPNELNIADLDITSIVKTFIRTDNDVFTGYAPLDYNSFTSFYIEYAESYQVSNGVSLSTYTSAFLPDTIAGCSLDVELFNNPDFTSGLTGWSQDNVGESWIVGAGDTLEANISTSYKTKDLFQNINLERGITYQISLNISTPNNTYFYIEGESSATGIGKIIRGDITSSIVFDFTADINYDEIKVIGYYQNQGAAYDGNASIISFSVIIKDCNTYLWGSNSVQQFQYYLGGNMGEYLVTPNNIAKFLTDFERLIYFKGKPFTVSSIISNEAFTNSYLGDNLYIRLTSGDSFVDRKIKNINDGVYQIGNQFDGDLFDSMLSELEVVVGDTVTSGEIEIYSVPANKFLGANNGNHNTTIDGLSTPPSDWGITITPYAAPSDRLIGTAYNYTSISSNPSYEGYGSGIFSFSSPEALVGSNKICDFTDTVTLEANEEYTLSFYFRDQATTGHDSRLDGSSFPLILPNGSFTGVTSSSGFPVPAEGDDTWYKNSIVFNTLGVTSFTFSLLLFLTEELSGGTGGALAIDNIELLGPYEQLTEKKPIRIDDKCSNQDIHLTWLNSLGGWEFFNFQSIKDYKVSSSGQVIKRDVFNNWDTEFITGNTENDYSSVRANKVTTVRSQLVTEAEADAIWNIKTSIKVQVVNDNNTLTTVLVDKGSFTKYKDRDKLYAIEFNITYPDTQIQNQ
jgi:hypothetical protein